MATRNSGKSGNGRNGTATPVRAPAPDLDTAEFSIDAEVAAMLDSEMAAVESPKPNAPVPDAPATRVPDSSVPRGADDISAASSPAAGPTQGSYLATVPPRPLPPAKRFGAVIVEAPVRAADAELLSATVDPRIVPPGPGKEGDDGPLPAVVIRTEDQKSNVIKRLETVRDPEWQRKFHAQIDRLYKEISEEFSTPPDVAQKMLEQLREARQLMIDNPEEFGNAEYRLMQVATSIQRRRQSRQQARLLGPWLFLYLTFWLLVFTTGLIFITQIAALVQSVGRLTEPQLANLAPILNTMLWGGIGGVVGGMYALWYHISDRQDFDKNYSMWYYVQPLMGLVLGAITFLILAGGFLIVQVNIADPNASAGARLIPYLVAVLAGFKQDFVYDQLERVVSIFAPGSAKPETSGAK
jgi:hypothetical protein